MVVWRKRNCAVTLVVLINRCGRGIDDGNVVCVLCLKDAVVLVADECNFVEVFTAGKNDCDCCNLFEYGFGVVGVKLKVRFDKFGCGCGVVYGGQ